ncbi:MAG: hypothetical protein FJZ62_04395 [Chlamydiae bacterium]|nr:hypothetical protein [Chlamydiota bacterium]
MSLNKIRIFPMLVASAGLFAASAPNQKKIDKNEARDCNYLCLPSPMQECDAPWDISAAATYQQVRVQGGDQALIQNDRTNNIFPVGGQGVQPYDDFAWGFRVGAGYTDYERNWRFGVEYNYFKAIFNKPIDLAFGQAFVPTAYANIQIDRIQATPNAAFSQTLFNNLQLGNYTLLNDVELTVQRPSMITPNIEFTTIFGIDAQFLQRRHLSIFTNGTNDVLSGTPQGFIANLGGYFQNYQKYTWWGVGPYIGFHSNWNLGSNFFMFFDAKGSLNYGLSCMRTATFAKYVLNGTTLLYDAKEAAVQNWLYQWSPTMKYLLGVCWSKVLDSSESRLSLRLAYSTQYFFYLMRSIHPEGAFRSENGAGFGIQGLVLDASVDF